MVGSPKCHKNIAIRKICAKSIFTFKVSGLAAVFFTKLVLVIKKFFCGYVFGPQELCNAKKHFDI